MEWCHLEDDLLALTLDPRHAVLETAESVPLHIDVCAVEEHALIENAGARLQVIAERNQVVFPDEDATILATGLLIQLIESFRHDVCAIGHSRDDLRHEPLAHDRSLLPDYDRVFPPPAHEHREDTHRRSAERSGCRERIVGFDDHLNEADFLRGLAREVRDHADVDRRQRVAGVESHDPVREHE